METPSFKTRYNEVMSPKPPKEKKYEHARKNIDLNDKLSKYLPTSSGKIIEPSEINKHVMKAAPEKMGLYDNVSSFLYLPGNPSVAWFCHSDNKMHNGMKMSKKYVAYLQIIATFKQNEVCRPSVHKEKHDVYGKIDKTFINRSPRSPRTDMIKNIHHKRNHSLDYIDEYIEKKKKENEKKQREKSLSVTWYGITNSQAIMKCRYDDETNTITMDVSKYNEKKTKIGFHSNVPIFLPSFYLAKEGGLQLMHPGEIGRKCSVFTSEYLSDQKWKKEFGNQSHIYVRDNHTVYCIDEFYIDKSNPLDPLKFIA